jgi:exopolyphosphatase / guanosine-5'-triphosphate,3'-diphosphate pyrophosphatase
VSATRRLAAIDIGTVTTRLLVADVGPAGIAEVLRSTDITHLGEGLTGSGRLSEAAMARVEGVIAGYAARMRDLHVEAWRTVATSASRDAANGAEFARMLAAHGVEPEIVPGDVEARLAFAGATHELSGEGLLINDIGGGSTELVLGARASADRSGATEVHTARSIDVGSRRVTELFLTSDPPAGSEIEAAARWIRQELAPFFAALPGAPRLSIALAGTATTLSAINQERARYDPARVHGSVLSVREIRGMLDRLASLPLELRTTEVIGLDPGRAPVIVAGTLILLAVLDLAGLDSTLVSEHDILYGIVLDLFARPDSGPRGELGLE